MKNLLLILVSALLLSCAEERQQAVPIPDEVVSEETMVEVLVDLHLVEASLSLKMMEDHRVAKDTAEFYNPYKKHKVTRKAFDESFKYYSSKPDKLSAIYEEVLNRLNQRQAEVMKSIPKDSLRKDSPQRPDLPGGPVGRPGMPKGAPPVKQ